MGDLSGVFLGFQIVLCDHNLLLVTAELDVIECHFSDDADLHVADIFDCGLDIGIGRFHVAAQAAEQVEFPHGVQTGLIKILFGRLA